MSLADYSSFDIFYTSNWFFKTLFGYKILLQTVILVYYTHVLYGCAANFSFAQLA